MTPEEFQKDLAEHYKAKLKNSEDWNKVISTLCLIFIIFTIYMFRCYGEQRVEIVRLNIERQEAIDSMRAEYAGALDQTYYRDTIIFNNP